MSQELTFTKKMFLQMFYWDIILFAVVFPLSMPQGNLDFFRLSDKLFFFGIILFLLGLIIIIINTSRHHYYKHLRDVRKGVEGAEEKYQKDQEKRNKQIHFGMSMTFAGIIGLISSALVLFLI